MGSGGWIDETAHFESARDRYWEKFYQGDLAPTPSFDAEYAEACASLPTMMPPALGAACRQIPCPSFEEVTLSVTPYLEIAERRPDAYWVRCLSCHSWVMPAEGGSPAEVLEHAEEIHVCGIVR